ncbi:MAG: aminopeptidase [Acidobacteria bacterium]|nr:aminopeptidase [Acidobacteriota bacterium]
MEIKDLEKTLGFQKTENFLRYSETTRAYYRCYYTGKLELPASYDELQLTEGDAEGCSLDEKQYDIFFYPIEAVATGTTPVTPALAQATLERILVVVPHEDFHNQEEAQGAHSEIGEAAATLIGFLTASKFSEEKYGSASGTFQSLNQEARLFLQKAGIVNSFYDKLSQLYASARSGKISEQEALIQKGELFTQFQRECSAITPAPASFNKCPAIMNNAGLAFDMTYTRYYPSLYGLYIAQGQDAKATVQAVKRLLATRPQSETDLRNALGAALPQQQMAPTSQ